MKKLAVIPARYAATRFPAKLMQPLGNKTVIRTTYDHTVATGLFDEVLVATDSRIIFEEIAAHGGLVVMSKKEHESGSDRIAEAINDRDVDIVVNVQGDEPFVNRQTIADLIAVFDDDTVQVASLMHLINDPDTIKNPNVVKVATDNQGNALFFSRSPIPYHRNMETPCPYYRHIGVYAYRKEALLSFVKWPMGRLENIEKLEQLRYLENGTRIRMVVTPFEAVGIDTPEDLLKAQEFLQTNP